MGVIQDNEYILYKSLAWLIKNGLKKPLSKLSLKCIEKLSKFDKQNELFLNCETYESLGDNSKKFSAQQDELIKLFAVQHRLEKILKRNEQRIDIISARLEQLGIYNDAVDKKTLANACSSESKNVSVTSLNINPKANKGITFKFFAGEILAFRDDVLDLALDENRDVMINGSSEFYHEFVSTFPYAVATIPDEYFLMPSIKNNILKECILFVASKIKSQSILESNRELGELLENVGEIFNISQYANELKNYFNVVVKQCIKRQAPELAEEADRVLRCNELSEFLPASRRFVDTSSESLEEKQITEEQESEEERLEQEGEEQISASREEILARLLNDSVDLEEVQEGVSDESETSGQEDLDSELEDTLRDLELFFEDNDEEEE